MLKEKFADTRIAAADEELNGDAYRRSLSTHFSPSAAEEDAGRSLDTVSRITSVGLIAAIALTPRLWTRSREFPIVPIYDLRIPAAVEPCLVVALLLILVIQVARKFTTPSAAAVSALMLVLLALDGMRAQPWYFQYLLTFAVLTSARRAPLAALNALQLIFAGIYIYSGLHKGNVSFVFGTGPWMAQPLIDRYPGLIGAVIFASLLAPIAETALGVMLLFPRSRLAAVPGLIIMHSLILLALGPAGRAWNIVVWPWNVAMMFFALALFRSSTALSTRLLLLRGERIFWPPLALALFFPALSFAGCWPAYFSWALYSADVHTAEIRIPEAAHSAVPRALAGASIAPSENDPSNDRFDPVLWTEKELRVVPPPEINVYFEMSSFLCDRLKHDPGVQMIIRSRPARLTGLAEETRLRCRPPREGLNRPGER